MGKNRTNTGNGGNNTGSNSTFDGELNTTDNRSIPLENDNYDSLEEFYEASGEYFPDGFEQFELNKVTYLIRDGTYSEQLKQTLKTIADEYEKEYPDKERGIKGVRERRRFLKRYDGMEYAPNQKLDVNEYKNNFKLELSRRGYTFSNNDDNEEKYYLENGRVYTAIFRTSPIIGRNL